MDLIHTCEIYLKSALESFDYDEQKLENCVQFYLYEEIRKREKFNKGFSKLLELMKKPNPQTCQDKDSCEISEVPLSSASVVVSELKEILQNKDFSNIKELNPYFFEKFGIEISQIEKLFKLNK